MREAPLDPHWVRRSFDRASATYDGAAVLQTEVRGVLLERLGLTSLKPRVVLDAGAGTGKGSLALKRRYPDAQVLALDFSPGMLRIARRRQPWLRRRFLRVCADAARLPLADQSVDLVFANFLLPWCDPDAVFGEFRRVLAPRGLLSFSSLGPDTLKELRTAWATVDPHPRVHMFLDMHDVGDALVRAGFAAPVLDVDRFTLQYPEVGDLRRDLRAMGSRSAAADRPRGLTGPRKLAAMYAAYEPHRREGRLPATFEVVYGHAWAPKASPRKANDDLHVPLEDMKNQLRQRRGG